MGVPGDLARTISVERLVAGTRLDSLGGMGNSEKYPVDI